MVAAVAESSLVLAGDARLLVTVVAVVAACTVAEGTLTQAPLVVAVEPT